MEHLNPLRELLSHAFGLSSVFRYARINLFRRQNVAEHSFNVALTLLYVIAEYENFSYKDKFEILAAGLLHDIEESITGDIIAPAKEMLSGVEEMEASAAYGILGDKLFGHWEDSRGKWGSLVKLADLAERMAFCKEEKRLGNKDEILNTIISTSQEKITKLKEEFLLWLFS